MGVRSVPRGRGLTPGRDLPVPQRVEEAGPRTSQGSRLPAPGSRPAMTSPLETSLASPLGSKLWESRSQDHLGLVCDRRRGQGSWEGSGEGLAPRPWSLGSWGCRPSANGGGGGPLALPRPP